MGGSGESVANGWVAGRGQAGAWVFGWVGRLASGRADRSVGCGGGGYFPVVNFQCFHCHSPGVMVTMVCSVRVASFQNLMQLL
jgi:hypothetical protein